MVLADVPPPPRNWNWTKHECYRTKSFQERSSSTFYNVPPPFQYHYLILCLNRKLVNFNFKWIWIYGLEPHLPPLTSPKKRNAHFWITFNFWWSAGLVDGLEPHLPPLSSQKMKCSFLDYIQLLMIDRAIWAMKVDRNVTKGPLSHQKWNAHFWITFNFWWSAMQCKQQKSTEMRKKAP